MRTRLLLIVALFLLAGCGSSTTVAVKPVTTTAEPPALCGDVAAPAGCAALVTRNFDVAAAHASPGETVRLDANYCGMEASGHEMGQDVKADAQGYYTWQWRTPAPLPLSCHTAILTISMDDQVVDVSNYELI